MLAVGVDVAEERKGLDLVALDASRALCASRGGLTVEQVDELVDGLRPDIVCIDSPSGWSISGASRRAERELARLRITAYATGADPGDHSFYRWMRVGFSLFEALADRYPLFRGADPQGTAAEVFPHASAVFLAGRARSPTESKMQFRRQVLESNQVDPARLRGIDRIDAALAALTGLVALEGTWSCVGDPAEGVILLPARSGVLMPAAPPVVSSRPMSLAGSGVTPCGCGCGASVRRRFLPGHDAKLKSRLLRSWRDGDIAAGEQLRDLGWIPYA